jgi:xylose isomerase
MHARDHARGVAARIEPEEHGRMSDAYEPSPDDHFTFGLWTVGNRGRDTFGNETRPPLDPVDSVHHLADIGAYGVSFHDDDLVPPGSTAAEREQILKRFRIALDATGLRVPMATTNLFSNPVFKDGAFTANDPAVRRWSITKTLDAVDMGVELGASVYVMWGGREGTECDAAKDIRLALDRYKEAVDICCAYARDREYDVRFALEPKPNEPRGNILLPTVGHALAFVERLEWPDMVGLNPEFAHETMSGLSFNHAVAQTLWAGKLFHIDLNGQVPGKYDQDFRFGSEGIRDAFYLVKLLEDSQWTGMRHFDAHAYRTEDDAGVWEFARGCIRSYLILRDKAQRFHADTEIQAALETAMVDRLAEPALSTITPDAIATMRRGPHDLETMATRGYGHERLDQLVTELLLGAR